MRRWVCRIHRHVLASKDSTPVAASLDCLLASIDHSTPVDVVGMALETLCFALARNLDALRERRGIERVLRYMMTVPAACVDATIAHHACCIASLGEPAPLTAEVLRAEGGATRLYDWYVKAGDARRLFSITLLFCIDETLRAPLLADAERLVDCLTAHLTPAVLGNPSLSALAFRALVALCRGSREHFEDFWERGGVDCLVGLAQHDAAPGRIASLLLDAVTAAPTDAALSVRRVPDVIDFLARDLLLDVTKIATRMAGLRRNAHLFAELADDAPFVHALLDAYVEHAPLAAAACERHEDATLALLEMALVSQQHDFPAPRLVALCDVDDPATHAMRAYLCAYGLSTAECVPHLATLSATLETLPDGAYREALDTQLCGHLNRVVEIPALLAAPLCVNALPPHGLLFHLVELIAHPTGGHSRFAARVRELLKAAIVVARAGEPSAGVEAHCRRLADAYGLDAPNVPSRLLDGAHAALRDCVSVCPVTLEPMHAPALANDGYTYELSVLVRLARSADPRSPMTREPLDAQVTFNRALADADRRLGGIALES